MARAACLDASPEAPAGPVDNLLTKDCCLLPATAGKRVLVRVPGGLIWLQWPSNKQLPYLLLEGASPVRRAFFLVS
jgi:hypothetical protein